MVVFALLDRGRYVLMVATCVVMLVGELPELSGLGVHTPIVPPSLPTRMRAGAEM